MKFSIACNSNGHQAKYSSLMREGIEKHGGVFVEDYTDPSIDFIVTWAWKPLQKNGRWEKLVKLGKPILVMERGYIGDRVKWISCGWNGLNNRADFCNKEVDDKRFELFKDHLKPWKNISEIGHLPVLVIGQVSHDAAVAHIRINDWYNRVVSSLIADGKQVIFRPHPLNTEHFWFNGNHRRYKEDTNEHLEKTLGQVSAVVTFNSNSGVISVLNGIPTVAYDIGAMAYDVSARDIKDLNYQPDRTKWCNQMAYAQWSIEEIRRGDTWLHLSKHIT